MIGNEEIRDKNRYEKNDFRVSSNKKSKLFQ